MAMKMHEIDVEPAPHHAPSRDWRVDPAREQQQRASSASNRQAASAGIFAVGDVSRMRQYLNSEIEFGIGQIDFKFQFFRYFGTDDLIDLHRVERKALVGAASRDTKASCVMLRRRGYCGPLQRL